MTVQEKRSIVNLCSTCMVIGIYVWCVYFLYPEKSSGDTENFRFWGIVILSLLPAQILLNIITHIIFTIIDTVITRIEEPYMSDERDKMIEMKATRNSYYAFMFSVLLCLIPVVLDRPLHIMFNLLACAFFAAQIVWSISQFYFYRRGY